MCGTVLVGSKGIHKISRSYLEFQGFMRDWKATPGSTWRDQTYISNPDKRQMAFCTELDDGSMASCFFDYIEFRRNSARVQREARLREEAGAEFMERNATGYRNDHPTRRGSPPPVPPPERH